MGKSNELRNVINGLSGTENVDTGIRYNMKTKTTERQARKCPLPSVFGENKSEKEERRGKQSSNKRPAQDRDVLLSSLRRDTMEKREKKRGNVRHIRTYRRKRVESGITSTSQEFVKCSRVLSFMLIPKRALTPWNLLLLPTQPPRRQTPPQTRRLFNNSTQATRCSFPSHHLRRNSRSI
jgi:hypothetical protein